MRYVSVDTSATLTGSKVEGNSSVHFQPAVGRAPNIQLCALIDTSQLNWVHYIDLN